MTQMKADVKNGTVVFNGYLKSRSDPQMTQMKADVKKRNGYAQQLSKVSE